MATTVLEGTDVKMQRPRRRKNSTTKNKEYVVALQQHQRRNNQICRSNSSKCRKTDFHYFMMDRQSVHQRVNQAIEGGEAAITGMSSYEEAETIFAATIRIGGLSGTGRTSL